MSSYFLMFWILLEKRLCLHTSFDNQLGLISNWFIAYVSFCKKLRIIYSACTSFLYYDMYMKFCQHLFHVVSPNSLILFAATLTFFLVIFSLSSFSIISSSIFDFFSYEAKLNHEFCDKIFRHNIVS